MKISRAGNILICFYQSVEERNEHIMQMCSDKPRKVKIYNYENMLMAEFIDEDF